MDPARAASILAIHRALAAQQIAAHTLQGIVIIEVPSPDWAEPVSSAWEDVVGSPATPRKASTYSELDARPNEWLIFRADGTDRRYSAERDNEQVARCIWQGENLLGVSHLPERYLPSNLMRAADLHLVLNPLDADGLRIVAQSVTNGTPTALPPPEACTVLSPLILRLARRPGQSADDFLQRARRIAEQQAPTAPHAGLSLDLLPGMDAAVAWGRDLARDLKLYAAGRLGWRDVDRGCLLAGPPGTGKTTYAKALATSCGVPLIWASYSRWQSSQDGHLGDLLRAMASSFDQARKAAPCILFIDELDSFHNRHGESGHRDWWAAVIGGLLEHLDGIEGREGVVVIGATNYPDIIDPAIIRSGRLDRTITVPLPDLTALTSPSYSPGWSVGRPGRLT